MEYSDLTEIERKLVDQFHKLDEKDQMTVCDLLELFVTYPESFEEYKKMLQPGRELPSWDDIKALIARWTERKAATA